MLLSTPWVRNSAGLAKDTVTYPGTVPTAKATAKARTTSARARAHANEARVTLTGTKAKEGAKANSPRSYGPIEGYQKGDGKSGGKGPRCGKYYTCGGDQFAPDCPKRRGKEGFRALEAEETWEEPLLVEHARVLSPLREAHAGPQRVPRELRKKFMTGADISCNCKDGHQPAGDEVSAPPGLEANGQDGEWEVKVSKKNQKSQKHSEREQAGRTLLQCSPTTRVPQSSLKMFKTIEPDHVKAVNADDGWEEIEFALDSGATETVMGEELRARGAWSTIFRPGNSFRT